MKRWIVVLVGVGFSCGHPDDGRGNIDIHTVVDQATVSQLRIDVERLRMSCQPGDIARLITIAAGTNIDPATPGLRDVRCDALQALSASYPMPHHWNPAVVARGAAVLERPPITAAISTLLADDGSWCRTLSADRERVITPRDATSELLSRFPVGSLEQDLSQAMARDEKGDRDNRPRVALAALKSFREFHESARAARIDAMVADATPDAFDRLIQFLADGMPWNDGRPPASGDEEAEIHRHIYDALVWLLVLARPSMPETGDVTRWDCETIVRNAMIGGALGQRLMANFEKLDLEWRQTILFWLPTMEPRGFAEWRARIAKEDPDPGIRQSAAPDILERLHPRDAGVDGP